MNNSIDKIEECKKMSFLKIVWYSITKYEKYPEMAMLGSKKILLYFTKLILILSIILAYIYLYYSNNMVDDQIKNATMSEKIAVFLTKDLVDNEEKQQIKVYFSEFNDNTIIFVFVLSCIIKYFSITLLDVVLLSVIGILTCNLIKIKIKYKLIFNMSVFALTLSNILRIIYISIITLTEFEIKYFYMMYIAIAYISLCAAIFIIKSDTMRKQIELMRIINESKQKIEESVTIHKKTKDDEKEKENEKENEDKKKKSDKDMGEQESNA